jgi:glycosyltransferase involved in cell wall biosynthesis
MARIFQPPRHPKYGYPGFTSNLKKPKVYQVEITDFVEIEEVQKVERKGKIIVQIARTNCAGAIWRIHDAINRYTPNTCRTITASNMTNGRKFPSDVLLSDTKKVSELLESADVIHFHNWIDYESIEMRPYAAILARKKKVLQYHTEPQLLQRNFQRNVVTRNDIKTLTIAQKHVRFYPHSSVVPNLVDIHDPVLLPVEKNWAEPLRVIYSPSDLKSYPDYTNTCCGKGYEQTIAILKKLENEGLIKATIITDMTWEQLMPIKRQNDVCIDECVTGGYHLCSLESLSQGLATIAWIDEKTEEAIEKVVGKKTELPWVNTKIDQLEQTLRNLVSNPDKLLSIKQKSRKWMEENWNPISLIQKFIDVYDIPNQPAKKTHIHHRWGNNKLSQNYIHPEKLKDIFSLENAWENKRVVIWGNGHTVNEAMNRKDENWFKESKHIGTNMAALLGIPFDAYCISDSRFLEIPEKLQVAKTAPGIKVYASFLEKNLTNLDADFVKVIGHTGISSDLREGFYHGFSVAWFALQVALWSGSKDILFAGCPFDYSNPQQPRFYQEKKVSPVDRNLTHILANFKNVSPILNSIGVKIRTIGNSKLQESRVEKVIFPLR